MIMALDLGDARTGVAFSDLTEMLAGRAYSLTEHNKESLLTKIADEIQKEKPRAIVIGLPNNMNGLEGERAESARDFAAKLEQLGLCKVVLWDERMTSIMANRILSDAGKRRGKQRAMVDAVAATIILQSYLDSNPNKK